jgi:hypothetical protein
MARGAAAPAAATLALHSTDQQCQLIRTCCAVMHWYSCMLMAMRTCVRHQDAHVWPRGCRIIVASLPPGGRRLIGFHRRRSGRDHGSPLRSEAMLHPSKSACHSRVACTVFKLQLACKLLGRHVRTLQRQGCPAVYACYVDDLAETAHGQLLLQA